MKSYSWLKVTTLLVISLTACREQIPTAPPANDASSDSPVIEDSTTKSELKVPGNDKLIFNCSGTQTIESDVSDVTHSYTIDPDELTAEFADYSEGSTKRITFIDIELTDNSIAGISSYRDSNSNQQAKFKINRESLSYNFVLQLHFNQSGTTVDIETTGLCQLN
jgi:hypothetical protein